MNFESSADAAVRLGCTARAIQKWAKDGRIPYAYKDGRDWKIPVDAVRPDRQTEPVPVYLNEPLPLVNLYTPGKAFEYASGIQNPDDRNIALCMYYYMSGDFKRAHKLCEPYIRSENPILCSTSALLFLFSNVFLNNESNTGLAYKILRENRIKYMNDPPTDQVRAVSILCSLTALTELHLSPEELPLMRTEMKYLDDALRIFSCYLIAYRAYHDHNYEKALGIVEIATNISDKLYPLPMIYLYIIKAVALINLMQPERAIVCIENAWEIASKDKFYTPFVEHFSLLQGLIEKHFKKKHPADYKKILSMLAPYNNTWYSIKNRREDTTLSGELKGIEITIAMLYYRGWRVKEIASYLELSERTITNYISVIYDKLNINSKKQLQHYLMK